MIKLKDLLTEGKISSDVERAAKKAGFKFKKITNDITTNKFSNPTGDVKKMGKDVENVEMNQWMSDEKSVTKQNYEELGMKLIKLLSSKYVPIKKEKYGDRGGVKFMNRKKDPRSEFWISYDKTIAGPYISYRGLKGV